MKLNEVNVFPRVYNVIDAIDPRFTIGGEIKVCHVGENLLLIAIGSGLAFQLTKDEAKHITVQSR